MEYYTVSDQGSTFVYSFPLYNRTEIGQYETHGVLLCLASSFLCLVQIGRAEQIENIGIDLGLVTLIGLGRG